MTTALTSSTSGSGHLGMSNRSVIGNTDVHKAKDYQSFGQLLFLPVIVEPATELEIKLKVASLVGQGKNLSLYVCLRWWSLVASYFGLIFKFGLELENQSQQSGVQP